MTAPMTAEAALWLVVGLPALAGAGLCIGGRWSDRVAAPTAVVAASVVVLLAAVVAVSRPAVSMPFMAGTPFALGLDALSAVVLVTVAVITLLVMVFSAAEMQESPARFHGLMLLFAAAVSLTATATTLPALLVAWEVMGATSYALIGFAWQQPGKLEAGATAFLTTRAADLGLYLAAGAALGSGSGLALADLAAADAGWRHAIAAGVLVAAVGKAAQLPFSFWLSRAMEGPSPVSALLHSAAMVAMGGYLLLRTHELLAATGWAATAAAWTGAVTALLLGAVALAQRDLKQLLAASTSAQLGFVVLAAGLGAVAGGTAHFVAHAATKALLFLVAGAWLTLLGSQQLAGLNGAARRWPVVGAAAGTGLLTLAGVAPLSLWATKDEVLVVAAEESPPLYVAGLAAAVLSTAYAGKVLFVVWRGAGAGTERLREPERATTQPSALVRAPLIVLAAGAALLGVLALPPVGTGLRRALGDTETATAGAAELVGSAMLALVVLAVVARRRLPEPAWARSWLGAEAAVHAVVVRPTLRLSAALARFDDRVLDLGVHRSADLTVQLARRLARLDLRRVDGLVESLARSSRRLGDIARLPQTGQLHEYYVQAAAALAVGVVLLLVLG